MPSSAELASPAAEDDHSIVVSRLFAAPPEVVFEAWVDPAQLARWWGPAELEVEWQSADIRPGGVSRIVMRDRDGIEYPVIVTFLEITPPTRLVYRNAGEPPSSAPPFDATVTFVPEGDGTRVTFAMRTASSVDREQAIRHYGAREGADNMLARLAAHLQSNAKGTQS